MPPADPSDPPASTPAPAPDPRVGTLIANRYKLLAPLGEGGIGTVYRAEDTALRMAVAVKLLRAELAREAEVVARFEREARAMTALSHENIVRAFNFGRTPEGDIVLVTELVEGESLRATLNRLKPFPVHGAVLIAGQIGAALSAAHAAGLVHRDLKPENVMVTWQGEGQPVCKVLDFGMARVLGGVFGGPSQLTRKGAVFGTPEYMSPEQGMGLPVDARGDQYALGVMLHEMLAGRRPFRAGTALEMVQQHIHTPVPQLNAVMPTVPPALAQVVSRMMAKRADERFPDLVTATAAMRAAVGWR